MTSSRSKAIQYILLITNLATFDEKQCAYKRLSQRL